MFLFIGTISFSQVYTLRTYNTFSKTSEGTEDHDYSVFAIVDMDKNMVKIDNQYDDVFFIRSLDDQNTDYDSDGDKFTTLYFDAYDNQGDDCTVTFSVYEKYNLVILGVIYHADFMYGYYAEIVNN